MEPLTNFRGFIFYIFRKGKEFMASPTEQPASGNKDKSGKTRNPRLMIILSVIGVAVVIASWFYIKHKRDYVSTDDAMIDANRVSVSARLLGRVAELTVDEGDSVYTGQVIVRLEDSDLRAQETQAQAALFLANENVNLTTIFLKRAEDDYKRAVTQYHDHVISKEQFDHAQNELETAKAKTHIAEAQVRTAEAQLGIVKTQLENTVIASPMNGVVSKRWVLPGDIIQPGQAIFSIYDLKNVWVTANLEETHIAPLEIGDHVALKIDAYPHEAFHGELIQIGSNTAAQFSLIPPNNASGNFTKITQRVPVKISIDPHPAVKRIHLLPGMSVSIQIKVR